MDVMTKAQITRRFRKVSWGRLCWRPSPNKRPDYRFANNEVCVVQIGSYISDRFTSLDAFIERIEYQERWQQQKEDIAAAWDGCDDFTIDGRVY